MTYESQEITAQMAAQLGALSDAAKYKAAAKAHIEYITSEERSIPTSYRPKSATGLLATDYAISDYTTWK